MRGQTNASNIGGTVGSNHSPIKIVNGVPEAVAYPLVDTTQAQTITGTKTMNEVYITNFIRGLVSYSSGTASLNLDSTATVNGDEWIARLAVGIDANSGTATIYLQKFKNGTLITSSPIHTL